MLKFLKLSLLGALLLTWNLIPPPPIYGILFYTLTLAIWAWTYNLDILNGLGIDTASILQDTRSYTKLLKRLHSLCIFSALFCVLFALLYYVLTASNISQVIIEWITIMAYICSAIFFLAPHSLWLEERKVLQVQLTRSIFDGFHSPVPLSDVILCDILTSVSKVIGELPIIFQDLFASEDSAFHPSSPWNPSKTHAFGNSFSLLQLLAALFLSIPYLIRLRQCISVYLSGKIRNKWDLVNAAKYASSLPSIFFSALISVLARYYSSSQDSSQPLNPSSELSLNSAAYAWFAFTFFSSVFSFWWDIRMDWQLGFGRRKFFFVGWIYAIATFLNLILRFVWILKLPLTLRIIHLFSRRMPLDNVISDILHLDSTLIVLEIFRRWVWVFFRIEREWNQGYDKLPDPQI